MTKIEYTPGVGVTIEDKVYYYDSESDCYCGYHSSPTNSWWDTWSWLLVIGIMSALALYLEFYPIR